MRHLARALLRGVAPALAGRRDTDRFSDTRTLGFFPQDVPPLGAARFAVAGSPDVRGGYLWGPPGPLALLVHGWGADSSSMHGLVPPMRDLDLQVAAFDGPAHGVNPGDQATMTQYKKATGAVLDTLPDVRVVIAHSLGSIAAIGALAERPGSGVRCVVLISPTNTLLGVLERWAAGDGRLPPKAVDGVKAELLKRNGVPVTHWNVAVLGGALTVPVLVLHAPDDPVVPFAEGEAVAAGLPGAALSAVPGTGHAGILSAPPARQQVAAFVARHLSEESVH